MTQLSFRCTDVFPDVQSLKYNLPGGTSNIPIPFILLSPAVKSQLTVEPDEGKLNRGISVVDTTEILRGSRLEGEEYKKVAILGWGVELVCATTDDKTNPSNSSY